MQLQLHYATTTTTAAPHHTTYIQQLWVRWPTRWPLQPLQPYQEAQLQPPVGPSVDSLCHLWFTTTNLSYRFPILKLPPPPCAVLLVFLFIIYIYIYICIRRTFRSQTSDNIDRWKSRGGKSQRRERQKKEDQRRERPKKEDPAREKVEKSRSFVFVQCFVAPEGWRVGSLKRQVRRYLVSWAIKNFTPSRREAHFEVKMVKTLQAQPRSTFGSWVLEKVHAVVVRSRCRSQNGKNTTALDYFWTLSCPKTSR